MYKRAQPREKRRKRLGPEVREEGLAAARRLLLKGGPSAVTLANIGEEKNTTIVFPIPIELLSVFAKK